MSEGYDGPARLLVEDREIAVRAHLSGHFDPITGRYQWSGRLDADDHACAELRANVGVQVRTGHGHTAAATLREQDPWGGFRISGTGRPPFAVPAETP